MEIGDRVIHPTHGEGEIIAKELEYKSVLVLYDKHTEWGNPIEQSECALQKLTHK